MALSVCSCHQGGELLEVSCPVKPLSSLSYLVNLCGKVLDCCNIYVLAYTVLSASAEIPEWKRRP